MTNRKSRARKKGVKNYWKILSLAYTPIKTNLLTWVSIEYVCVCVWKELLFICPQHDDMKNIIKHCMMPVANSQDHSIWTVNLTFISQKWQQRWQGNISEGSKCLTHIASRAERENYHLAKEGKKWRVKSFTSWNVSQNFTRAESLI